MVQRCLTCPAFVLPGETWHDTMSAPYFDEREKFQEAMMVMARKG